MEEYLKRKLARLNDNKFEIDKYPLYYQKGDLIVKETIDGKKFVVEVDDKGNELLKGEIQ